MGILACLSFSLPYGENSSWIMRTLTSVTFGCIGMPLGVSSLMLVAPVVFLGGWLLSNNRKINLQWKIVEAITGFAIALPIADMLYRL